MRTAGGGGYLVVSRELFRESFEVVQAKLHVSARADDETNLEREAGILHQSRRRNRRHLKISCENVLTCFRIIDANERIDA